MAFHVACPITCRRICFCKLGFPRKLQNEKAKNEFLEEIVRVEEFVKDPLCIRVKEASTVQVAVPRVVVAPPVVPAVAVVVGDGGEADELLSAQTKRAAMQRKAAAASMEAEDYARRFETGDLVGTVKEVVGEEQGQANAKVMCRLCFSGENEGSERARKMLSCKSCNKKYHRGCVKSWAQHRDLFHWSSWTCPSCRVCEVCRRAGDPNKFMFCKRCDGAYHCYCQQPPHKNVSSGPYLCPKHTKCHSCNSTVPGNGLSVRWFLGYTCCDACGRLFVKGNYCPVCLKVYRDSESTPMVCCDVCQRWVHCNCDGISDEKYQQFQADGNLHYKCATCRGECYQVRDVEDAVRELWTRRDEADKDLIANFRAAAGLPTQEEIFSISPFSDDEENTPNTQKNEYGRSLKFSLKGLADNKSPKKKSSNKKSSKKKTNLINKTNLEHSDAHSVGYSTGDNKDERENDFGSYAVAGNLNDGVCSINQAGVVKHKFVDDVSRGINVTRTSKSGGEEIGKSSSSAKTTKGPKLVIHLGGRNKSVINSPMSESSCQKDLELTTHNGNEAVSQQRVNDRHIGRHITTSEQGDGEGDKKDNPNQVKPLNFKGKEGGNTIKIKKPNPELSNTNVYVRNKVPPTNTRILLAKRNADKETATAAAVANPTKKNNDDNDNDVSKHPPKDPKPLLRLKFKNPYYENQTAWAPAAGEEEKGVAKGQRSKRKRPNFNKEEGDDDDGDGDDDELAQNDSPKVEMDANWILQKLGKEAVGKRVEVHQSSSNSWHKGTIKEVMEGTSIVSIDHDDGKAMNLDLGKQRIRFISKKQKR